MSETLKKITADWFIYHLKSFFVIFYIFHPFRLTSKRPPLLFRPGSPLITFIFALVILLIILIPLVLFIGNAINGFIIPELFIVIAFGLAFGTFFRVVQGETCTYIEYDGNEVKFTKIGFWEKKIEVFKRNQLSGLVLYKHNFQGTKNHKVCLLVNNKKLILLDLTIFKKKAQRLFKEYCEAFQLKKAEKPGNTSPVNDVSIKF